MESKTPRGEAAGIPAPAGTEAGSQRPDDRGAQILPLRRSRPPAAPEAPDDDPGPQAA